MLCDASQPIKTGKKFDAQVVILEHKSIICAGYSAVMHIHCAAEEITVNVSHIFCFVFFVRAIADVNLILFSFSPSIAGSYMLS